MNAIITKRHIADSYVEEVVWEWRVLKPDFKYGGVGIERFGKSRRNGVNFYASA